MVSDIVPKKRGAHRIRHAGILVALFLAGCAGPAVRYSAPVRAHLEAGAEVAECARLFAALDQATARAGVPDSQAARIPGYPYLRVNRFLAGGMRPDPDSPAFDDWVALLQRLDRDARRFEVANLPVDGRGGHGARVDARIGECGTLLGKFDSADRDRRHELVARARVPDEYRIAGRVFGLYPFTAWPFLRGVRRLHTERTRIFALPLEALEIEGELLRFMPRPAHGEAQSADAVRVLAGAASGPLGIPVVSHDELQALFEAFAPILEIDVASDADRIGTPVWDGQPNPRVDVSRPVIYMQPSYTRFGGVTLLQLNYIAWFPSRPTTGSFDLLGGHMDGITWRVTLGEDGRPLIYDSMHNCGCYHLFLPTSRVALKARAKAFEEPPLVPHTVASAPGRLVIRIANRTHYIQQVYTDAGDAGESGAAHYALHAYDELRSLPLPDGGRRSLFGADGIIAGTERKERYVFWPMGVPEPGAMRQWGRHATAFVGRRHFDDPDVIERYFELRQ